MIKYYTIDEDYTLKKLGVTAPTSEMPILDESEFKALEYSLELNNRLSQFLVSLYYCFYQDKISNSSYEKLAKIVVNKEAFQVEVIKRVDS